MVIPTQPPTAYVDVCPECDRLVMPTELAPDAAGWFAIYDHCTTTWTKGWSQ